METRTQYATGWAESITSLADIVGPGLDGLLWALGTWGLRIINWSIARILALDNAAEIGYDSSDAREKESVGL